MDKKAFFSGLSTGGNHKTHMTFDGWGCHLLSFISYTNWAIGTRVMFQENRCLLSIYTKGDTLLHFSCKENTLWPLLGTWSERIFSLLIEWIHSNMNLTLQTFIMLCKCQYPPAHTPLVLDAHSLRMYPIKPLHVFAKALNLTSQVNAVTSRMSPCSILHPYTLWNRFMIFYTNSSGPASMQSLISMHPILSRRVYASITRQCWTDFS